MLSRTIDSAAAWRNRSSDSALGNLEILGRLGHVEHADPVQAGEESEHGGIDVCLGHLSTAHGGDHVGSEGPAGSWHLEVQPGTQRRGRLGHGEPVRHDQSLKTPLLTQDVEQELRLLGQPAAVEPVVRGHDGQSPALANGHLEREEVQLAERPLVNDRVDGAALEFGVIAHEVLDRGKDAVRLDPPHVAGGQTTREQWVLGIALEVAAGQGRPVEIDRRRQQAPTAAIERFLADQRAQALGRRRVPGGADGRAAGYADGGRSPASGQPAASCSRRPVGDVHLRDVQAGDGPGRE